MRVKPGILMLLLLQLSAVPARATTDAAVDTTIMQPADVFDLEYATDPQLSPDGRTIAYVRRSFDIMQDRARSNIWLIDVGSGVQRPLLTGTASFTSPRWSPDGKRIAYISAADSGSQIYVRWLDSASTARLTDIRQPPSGLAWSPRGDSLAFTMFVKDDVKPFAKMPSPPEGASWSPLPIVIDRMHYRGDGDGYYEQGYGHVFVVPALGGTPRQVTRGSFDHKGTPAWSVDGQTIFVSADREAGADRRSERAQIHAVDVATGNARALTTNVGMNRSPRVSPDGKRIAYLSVTDNLKAYQPYGLWVMNIDGGDARRLVRDLDRDIDDLAWDGNAAVAFRYDDEGTTKLGSAPLAGGFAVLATGLGGEDLGRPYGVASFSSAAGRFAFNVTTPREPADIAVFSGGGVRRLTRLNDDLNAVRRLSEVETIQVTAPDGVRSQGWILKPPGFDAARKYPLILEIHGGPHANYGPRFTAELQMFAAAGYVVLFTNPRGSTSYGEAFGNMIDKAYPGGDHDDLLAAVDAVVARGYVDHSQMFVTGGSGGGVLTAWLVGKTDRFRAAVVAKPVINWTSFVLNADSPAYFARYWFGRNPWDDGAQADYWRRSPLSLVGNVRTPTMLLTGEADYRTPISESEQYYAALQLQGVDTAMVRLPEAGHAIVDRPSRLMAKVGYILAWFERYRTASGQGETAATASAVKSVNMPSTPAAR